MTVMSSLWSSHLTGWPQWTAPGGHLLFLLTASWTINKTQGCSIWICRCKHTSGDLWRLQREVDECWEGGGRTGGMTRRQVETDVLPDWKKHRIPSRGFWGSRLSVGAQRENRFGGNRKWFGDFWATGTSIDLRKTPNTSSLMCWGGNGGDLSSFWARSAVFS